MKYFTGFFLVFLLTSCSQIKEKSDSPFVNMRGCFLLYNLKSNTFDKIIGETCSERFPACSTFKVPLAVMAFDSGVLKDEKQVLKWDGKKRMLSVWDQDHSGSTWLKESVVWFSQRITPLIGEKKVQKYLDAFDYGNKDISTGLTSAWLNAPNDPKGSLALSAYEQVEFMKKLWTNSLPASQRSMDLTRDISYLETSKNGFRLSGKTGSNGFNADRTIQFGWFIAHLSRDGEEYIAVTNISDLAPVEGKSYGGTRAKEITKKMLEKSGLWQE